VKSVEKKLLTKTQARANPTCGFAFSRLGVEIPHKVNRRPFTTKRLWLRLAALCHGVFAPLR